MSPRFASLLLLLAAPALAAPPPPAAAPAAVPSLQTQVDAELAKAPKGTRFGLLVVDQSGRVVVSVNPDMRFIPASNTKLFTTAAAMALLPGIDKPDVTGGTQVFLFEPVMVKTKAKDVLLYGRGDARMSSASDCTVDCLAVLADAVAARTKLVGNVTGDDSFFPDQRWSPGMSWNNLGSNDATAASALSLDANEMTLRVVPGLVGKPPVVTVGPYAIIRNEAGTVAAGMPNTLGIEHKLNSREFRLYGDIPLGASEWSERIGIDDPADYAAFTFAGMLRARGVKVTGKIGVRHQSVVGAGEAQSVMSSASDAMRAAYLDPLASLTPPPLLEEMALINKPSQNHHAELLLRRIGRIAGTGSLEDSLAAEMALFASAGIPREGYDFSDGSGMSTYNRVSPRAMIALLRWGMAQGWGQAWLASFPIAGRDGTLKRRFTGTPLEGRLLAKTGTLNATNALSGTFQTASGQTLTFAFYANDVPGGTRAIPTMEAVLQLIAAAR